MRNKNYSKLIFRIIGHAIISLLLMMIISASLGIAWAEDPIYSPDPPSTLLLPNTTEFSLSVRSVDGTACRYSIGAPLPFNEMTPFEPEPEPDTDPTRYQTVIRGLSPDPNTVNEVYVRCGANPDFVMPLRYRVMSDVNPPYPRTGNLWGSWNFIDKLNRGETTLEEISHIDLWLGADFNATQIHELRQLNPNIRILTSINAVDEHYDPSHDSYFLKDIYGKIIEVWPGMYHLNLTKPEVAEYQAQYAYQRITDSDLMFDGCFFDNVFAAPWVTKDVYGNPKIDSNEDGIEDDPEELNAAWKAGVIYEMVTFRQLMPNAIISNHAVSIYDTELSRYFNGIGIGFSTTDVIENKSDFLSLWNTYKDWHSQAASEPWTTMVESAPPDQIAYGYGFSPQNSMPSSTLEFARTYYPYVRFGLAFTLMNDGYFAHEFGDIWHGNDWWYDELDFNLGYPLGPANFINMGENGPNIIENGNFEQPINDPWTFWANTDEGCAATFAADSVNPGEGTKSVRININATSGVEWHINFGQPTSQLVKGSGYYVVFWAKSDVPRSIALTLFKGTKNYGLYKNINISSDWEEYTVPFTANATASDVVIQFQVGQKIGTVWLDDVRVFVRPPDVMRRDFTNGLVLLNASHEPQTISIGQGHRRLIGNQAALHEYIIDDSDAAFSYTGNWTEPVYDSGEWTVTGPFYHDWGISCHETTESNAEARWALSIPEEDFYTITAWWPTPPSSSTWSQNVIYEVVAGSQVVASATFDQSTPSDTDSSRDEWHMIGNVLLKPEDGTFVRIRNNDPLNNKFIADAIHVRSAKKYNNGLPTQTVTLQPMDGIVLARFTDLDGDGYSVEGGINGKDCNDSNPAIHPGATEVCDEIDNNCDGQIDEGVLTTYYEDADGDGYGNLNAPVYACQTCLTLGCPTLNNTDCDDNNTAIHPGVTEICGNNIDENCDWTIALCSPTNWYNDGSGGQWEYRQPVIIGAGMTTAVNGLSNFPVLVKITGLSNPVFPNAQTDWDDIVFTASDGVTKLPHEIEKYDTANGTLIAWVKLPVLSSEGNTIYMYYGNGNASNQQNPQGVWDGDFTMVQHLEETSGQHLDSTANLNNSTSVNLTGQGVPGKIGGADEFVSSHNDKVEGDVRFTFPAAGWPYNLITAGTGTIEVWYKPTGNSPSAINVWELPPVIGDRAADIAVFRGIVDGQDMIWFYNGGANADKIGVEYTPNEWVHLIWVHENGYLHAYKNGQEIPGSPIASGETWANRFEISWNNFSGSNYLNGFVDEVRTSKAARSAEWIQAEYNNQNSPENYIQFTTQEIFCTDSDNDGYAVEGGECGEADCDDNDSAVNPGKTEVRSNGKDDDCDPNTIDAPPAITVDVNKGPDGKLTPIPINRGVLGNNMLGYYSDELWHTRYYIDGAGVWNPDSSTPGSVQQMINYAKQIGISYSRFPGGDGVHYYDWKKTVGPIGSRPGIRDENGDGTLEKITFGIAEFLQNTEDIGAIPVITMSDFTGTAVDAADLVEYLNSPNDGSNPNGGTDWAQVRAADGHPDPWDVVWFEYGNETNLFWTAEEDITNYINNYINYRDEMRNIMRAAYPNLTESELTDRIKLGAVLENYPLTNLLTDGWNTKVIEGTGQVADFFITHVYAPWYNTNDGIAANELFEIGLAGTDAQMQSYFQKLDRLIYEMTGRNNVPIAVTEFSGGFPAATPLYRHSLGNALINADIIQQFMHADNIVMANHWQFANSWTGMVAGSSKENPNKPYYVRPNFYPFELYNNHFGDTLISAQVESDTYETNGGYIKVAPAIGVHQDEEFSDDDALSNVTSWTISQTDGAYATESDGILTVTFDGSTDVDYSHSKKTATLEPNTWYRLSGYIKTDLTSSEGVYLAVQSGDNLVSNPGFEDDFADWQSSSPSGAATSIDNTVFHTGRKSAKVIFSNAEINYFHTSQNNIPVTSGTSYLLAGYIKTDALETDGQGVILEVQDTRLPHPENIKWAWQTTPQLKGRNDWTYSSIQFTTNPDTEKVRVFLRRNDVTLISGTAWWDDVRLYNGTESRKITGTTAGALDGWRYVEADFKSSSNAEVDVVVKRNSGGGNISGIAKIENVKLQKFTTGKYGAVPYLSINASKSEDGSKVYLMVINKNMTANITTNINLDNFKPISAQAWTLNGDSVDATIENCSCIPEEWETCGCNVKVTNNIIPVTNLSSFDFPAHSLTALEINGYPDNDGDGYTSDIDCNDSNPIEHPDQTWYADTDNDGYSDGGTIVQCLRPAGYKIISELTATLDDCDDTDPAINPATYWYPDSDEDGYGNPSVSLQQCTQPTGYILNNTDCNDNDVNIYPGGPPVRITRTSKYYSFLQAAYDDPETADGDTIQSQAVTLIENPNFHLNKLITIQGGYDCDYSTQTGKTMLNGNMTISDGTVTMGNFSIEP